MRSGAHGTIIGAVEIVGRERPGISVQRKLVRQVERKPFEGRPGIARDVFLKCGEIVQSYVAAGELRSYLYAFAELRKSRLSAKGGNNCRTPGERMQIDKAAVHFANERHFELWENGKYGICADDCLRHAEKGTGSFGRVRPLAEIVQLVQRNPLC